MSERLNVAICQMCSIDDVETNLMQIDALVEKIPADSGVRIAFFPENCLYQRLKEGEIIRGMNLQDEPFLHLAALAKKRKIHLHLGSVPLRMEGHLYNASVWIKDSGEVVSSYQKMHLFDIDLENGPSLRESDVFRHGQGAAIFEVDGWKFGQTICYDLRFAELYSQYAKKHVDAILVPSAFLVKTGEAHWEVLLRARAIESQCYVIAAAQAGVHRNDRGNVRETYGHSVCVEPWGRVAIESSKAGPDVLIHALERSDIDKVRRQIPMRDHRRLLV